MMNDTFNIKRFGWLLRKSVMERPALILGLLFVTMATTFLCYAFLQSTAGIVKAQVTSFMIGFFIGGSFMASSVFNYFSTNASGSSFLLLPASHLEKWLCGILISGVLFTIFYFGFYRAIDILFINHYRNGLDRGAVNYQTLYHSVDIFTFNNAFTDRIYLMYANVAAAMLLGSLYFNKVSFIKMALIICGFVTATYLLNLVAVMLLFKNVDMALPFDHIFLKVGNGVGIIGFPSIIDNIFHVASLYVIPGGLLLITFVRLKEKEV